MYQTAGRSSPRSLLDLGPNKDLVLGLEWMGEARAYPIRMLIYHHIVNDTVADRPLLITY